MLSYTVSHKEFIAVDRLLFHLLKRYFSLFSYLAYFFLGLPFVLLVGTSCVMAEKVVLEGNFLQGGMVRGQGNNVLKISLDGRPLRISSVGSFVFGFGRSHADKAILFVHYSDGFLERRSLNIKKRVWEIQYIDGLPDRMVNPKASDLTRIRSEAREVALARRRDIDKNWFEESFVWPVKGRITGVYGTARVLNGKPRQPHYGIDIAAPSGTSVIAPASGLVTLAKTDHYFTGGTVILDHGHGVSSTFLHLQELSVTVGQTIRQGDRIGTVGATGRATGPHLDWRVNWFKQRLDPVLLVEPAH